MQEQFDEERAALRLQIERATAQGEDKARAAAQRDVGSAEARGYAKGKLEAEQSVKTLRDVAAAGAKRAREDGAAEARQQLAGQLEDAKRAKDAAFNDGHAAATREAEKTMALMRADVEATLSKAEEAHRALEQHRQRALDMVAECEATAAGFVAARQKDKSEIANLQGIVDELTAYIAELLAQQSKSV